MSAFGGTAFGGGMGVMILKSRPRSGMGWDQIADALGALGLGGILGLVTFSVLSLRLEERRALGMGLAVLVLGPLLLVIAARLPGQPAPTAPVIVPFEPTFVFQMYSRIAAGEAGPPPGTGDFPFRELRVDARAWQLHSKGWGPATTRRYCSAELVSQDLQFLAPAVQEVFDQADESLQNCPAAGRATFSVTVEWAGETRGAASFGLDCVEEGAPMVQLLERYADVHDRVCE